MNKTAKKLKSIIKKETFGTNPWDPWSAKAGLSEAAAGLLNKFLLSRGINPKFLTKYQSIGYSRSNEFKKWAQDHQNLQIESKGNLNNYLLSKGINPKFVSREQKIGHAKSLEFQNWAQNRQYESVSEDMGHLTTQDSSGKTKDRAYALTKAASAHREIKTPPGSMRREDIYQDPMAATQTVFDGANNTDDVSEKKRQMSKSARMIKALYKMHRVVKEDMYDHEKEDKSVATYGKKPKHEKVDDTDNLGDNKVKAAAILSGGTTLTGQKRDTIEIDPMMRVRPGQPDPTKKDPKKDK